MTAQTATVRPSVEAGLEPPDDAGPRASLQVLRWVAVLHSAAMVIQPVLAGVYLSGDVDAIRMHGYNAMIVTGFDVLQLICAIVFTWKGRGRAWPIYASLAIALAVEVQVGVGFTRILAVHIPLGVSIIAMQILLTVWLFRSAAAARRRRRARRPERERRQRRVRPAQREQVEARS
jgi:hypothetical protein